MAPVPVPSREMEVAKEGGTAVRTDQVTLKKDSKLRAEMCMRCRYHLFCKYNLGRYGSVRMFIMTNLFDPEGIMFGCDVILPNTSATDEITVDMKWDDIEKVGRDAWEEVQEALRH